MSHKMHSTPEELLLTSASLSPAQRSVLLRDFEHRSRAMSDALYWMQVCTKTKDEQDPENPFKPFPSRPYFQDLVTAWNQEPILFVLKSRTLMATWLFSALCLYHAMTHPAAVVLFMAQDEQRSLIPLDYAWTLWEQQEPMLQYVWPLDRPKDKQTYTVMELKNHSKLIALPGKDPDKIRGFHPSVIFFDEAADHEQFGAALDIALATRVPKLVAVSSAKPSDFCTLTETAQPVEWYAPWRCE